MEKLLEGNAAFQVREFLVDINMDRIIPEYGEPCTKYPDRRFGPVNRELTALTNRGVETCTYKLMAA